MSADAMPRRAMVHFALDHPTAAGHFPGYPIIPGAALLEEIVSAIAASGTVAGICEVRAAKFLRPVRPGDSIDVKWTAPVGRDVRFEAFAAGNELAVTGALVVNGGP